MIKVRGVDLPVNIQAEIEHYDWKEPNWKDDRLICCSPFRDEETPSFAVNLENGTWIDSGGDGEFRKGNFIKLLAWIRQETYEETEGFLFQVYSPDTSDISKLSLDFDDWLTEEKELKFFTKEDMKPFLFKHPYLERRGIPYNVQRAFGIGYDPNTKSVVIPWHDKHGRIVSWKQRAVHSKAFWYVKGGQLIRNHLYGIYWVVKRGYKKIWIVESEIDALTLWAQGIPAVAIGTSYLSKAKRDLLLSCGIEEIVIATDNDKQGRKARQSIIDGLQGIVHLYEFDWTNVPYKDINDARDIIREDNRIIEIDPFGW